MPVPLHNRKANRVSLTYSFFTFYCMKYAHDADGNTFRADTKQKNVLSF